MQGLHELGLLDSEHFCLPESSGSTSWSDGMFGFSLLWLEECLCVWAGLMLLEVEKTESSRPQQHSDGSSVPWQENSHLKGCYEQKNWGELGKVHRGSWFVFHTDHSAPINSDFCPQTSSPGTLPGASERTDFIFHNTGGSRINNAITTHHRGLFSGALKIQPS